MSCTDKYLRREESNTSGLYFCEIVSILLSLFLNVDCNIYVYVCYWEKGIVHYKFSGWSLGDGVRSHTWGDLKSPGLVLRAL